jgi:hypothetical protein
MTVANQQSSFGTQWLPEFAPGSNFILKQIGQEQHGGATVQNINRRGLDCLSLPNAR